MARTIQQKINQIEEKLTPWSRNYDSKKDNFCSQKTFQFV